MSTKADAFARLACTQRRLAGQYAAWVREGGKDADKWQREMNRLRKEARKHLALARAWRINDAMWAARQTQLEAAE